MTPLLPKHQPHLLVVEPVNTCEALVTEYRRDNLNIGCGGNAIDIYVSISGSLMPRRWQPHHQDRAGRLTPCLFQNFTVFSKSMRRTEVEGTHRQPMFLKEQRTLLLLLL